MTVLDPVTSDTIQHDEVSVELNVVWYGSLEIGTLCLKTWQVVNTQQPGMGLPRGQCSLLNRFRTDEWPCRMSGVTSPRHSVAAVNTKQWDLLRCRHHRTTSSTGCGLQLAAETKPETMKSKQQQLLNSLSVNLAVLPQNPQWYNMSPLFYGAMLGQANISEGKLHKRSKTNESTLRERGQHASSSRWNHWHIEAVYIGRFSCHVM